MSQTATTQELIEAINSGDIQLAEQLLSQGVLLNAPDIIGRSPLHYAARLNAIDMMSLLLVHGAQINQGDTICGDTPLHIASAHGNTAALSFLLAHGANVNARNAKRDTPLHVACAFCRPEAVRVLGKHGAALDVVNVNGDTVHDIALSNACLDLSNAIAELVSRSSSRSR